MPISVTCSKCDRTANVKDEIAGKRFKCPNCGFILLATAEPPAPAEPSPASRREHEPAKATAKTGRPQRSRSERKRPAATKKKRRRRSSKSLDDPNFLKGIGSHGPAVETEEDIRKKRNRNRRPDRESHPERFEDFDKIVTEVIVFFIGFGVIVAALGAVIYYSDSSPSDAVRHKRVFIGMLSSGVTMCVMGMIACTRHTVALHLLTVVSLAFVLVGVAVVFVAGVLTVIVPFAFAIACARIMKAINLYPR